IDWVNEDIAHLQRKLGPSDRTKVSEYLDTVRELERRIQRAEGQMSKTVMPDLDRPIGVPSSYVEHAKLLFDLLVLAYQTDVTRVMSFQLSREASTRTYPEVGVTEAHHPTSHHGNDPTKLAQLAKINSHHVSLFGYFLEKLQATKEGDGSLLDHSMMV